MTLTVLNEIKLHAKNLSDTTEIGYQQALEVASKNSGLSSYQRLLNQTEKGTSGVMGKMINKFDVHILNLSENLSEYRNRLQISQQSGLSEIYAPFDHINYKARIAIVGLTPGDQQARNALRAYREARRNGDSQDNALDKAKVFASFSGPMRSNLVSMLDQINVNQYLAIDSCAELFQSASELCHFTSLLRYPIFANGENYSGTPKPHKTPYLWELIESYFCHELAALNNVLWVPLGSAVKSSFEKLIKDGLVSESQVLMGLPHPSGANSERISYFLGKKPRALLSTKTNSEKLDLDKVALNAQVASLMPTSSTEKASSMKTKSVAAIIPKPTNSKSSLPAFTTQKGNSKFMSQALQSDLIKIAKDLGFSFIPGKGQTAKLLELKVARRGCEESTYIYRSTGLSAGRLQVALRPSLGQSIDSQLLDLTDVTPHINKKAKDNPRIIIHSNMTSFNNKQKCVNGNEHFGWGYDININNGYSAYKTFLEALIQ